MRLCQPLDPAKPQDLTQEAGELDNRRLLGACRPQGDKALYGLPWLLDIRLFYFWRDSLPGFERNLRNAPSARDAFEQTVRSGGSYLSQNDLRIHFGLGSRERVDKVEILWPTGKKEILTDLAADHFYNVKEGAGIIPIERSKPVLPKY